MRLDKFLCEMNLGTRSQIKKILKQGLVSVNGEIITQGEVHVQPENDEISCQGKMLTYRQTEYFMMNKPAGVLSATKDPHAGTVIDLLPEGHRKDLFPVGRLDKDTEGFLLITNDGDLAHRLLSPKKHVAKTYLARIDHPLTKEDIMRLEEGIQLSETETALPSKVTPLSDWNRTGEWIHITVCEGKFHQVKRMLQAVGNEVLFLKRIRFGSLILDKKLAPGECRRLTSEEVEMLNDTLRIASEKQKLLEGKEAVIFDLDGSMVDSMWMWGEIDREYLGRFGIPLDSCKDLQSEIEGMSFHETAVYFKNRFSIPDSIEKMKEDWNRMAWEKYEKEVPLKEGIPDFLSYCAGHGIKLGIATSNSRELVDQLLKAHRLDNVFSVILTGSEVLKGKPAPDIYLEAARRLQTAPEKCLVFEDIIPGLQAAKSAGMTICAVGDAYSEDIREEKFRFADGFIEDFYDFFSLK
ncbi:MAG: pseudouridine synthase [Lachnospiraceae bacterium]|nr:pseudouridine synthase [Lachnospiraceae bacterium]MBP5223416.1 pseudouridine synthase [Lachnospiraceae bacterium]